MSFRASDRRHWRGNPFPAPAGAEIPASLCEGGVTAFGHDGGIVCTGFLPCHSEPVTDVTGVGIRSPRPQARKPLPPSVREVSRPSAMTEGEICRGSAAASSLPCVKAAQCSHWVVRRSVAEVSALRADGGIVCIGFLSCHSEPVTDVTGVGIRPPRPQARKSPPPSAREVSWPSAMTEGERKTETGGAEPRPYALPTERASPEGVSKEGGP